MTGCPFPVVDPSLSNLIRSLDKIVAWTLPMLDHDDKSGIEFPLRVINIG